MNSFKLVFILVFSRILLGQMALCAPESKFRSESKREAPVFQNTVQFDSVHRVRKFTKDSLPSQNENSFVREKSAPVYQIKRKQSILLRQHEREVSNLINKMEKDSDDVPLSQLIHHNKKIQSLKETRDELRSKLRVPNSEK